MQVIAAEGEYMASRALKDASDVINESSSALQLRYLQTLTQISAEKNSTIIFPLPVEILASFAPASMQPHYRHHEEPYQPYQHHRQCESTIEAGPVTPLKPAQSVTFCSHSNDDYGGSDPTSK
jgi:hypothetical protein